MKQACFIQPPSAMTFASQVGTQVTAYLRETLKAKNALSTFTEKMRSAAGGNMSCAELLG